MSFGNFDRQQPAAPMADINVTPMVDVLLVLLVLFILTAPLLTHSIRLDLPQAGASPATASPATIHLAIDADGDLYWDDVAVSAPELALRFAAASRQVPQPSLQLRADKATRYDVIAKVMAAAQKNNLGKLGFVTDPEPALAGQLPR